MPTNTFFGGQVIVTPGVYSTIDDAALAAAGIVASSTIGAVGPSTGGAPNAPLSFTTAAQAQAVLRSGSLLDCVRKAFDPGGNSPGAALIVAIRAGSPTQSTLTLNDATAAASINLTSIDYGVWTTQIRVAVAAGTTQGKKVTIAAPVAGLIQTIVQDNIYRAAMSIQYSGSAAASAMTITATQLSTSNTGGVDNVTLTFALYPTLQQLVDALNATGKYTTAVLGDPTAASSTLDGVTSQDIKTALYTSVSVLQAVIDFFNGAGDPFLTAVKAANAVLPPNNIGTTYLTGGTDGSGLVTADYTTALQKLEAQNVGIVIAASNAAAVHAAVLAHVNAMSGASGKRERIAVVGGAKAETVAQTLTRAAALGAVRVGLAYPGIKDFDPTATSGNPTLITYDPFYTAAAIAGVLAGGAVSQAATYKVIGAQAMESSITDSDVISLLGGGVIPVQFVTGRGNRVVQSISTYTADQNARHVELSVARTCDALIQSVRSNCEGLVGRPTGPALVTEVSAIVDSTLRLAFQNGLLVGDATHPPYQKIQVQVNNNTVSVTFLAQVGIPANYINIVAHLTGFGTA